MIAMLVQPSPCLFNSGSFTLRQEADVKGLEVSLVEVHGTGTALGDPIEVGGMCLDDKMGQGRFSVGFGKIGLVFAGVGMLWVLGRFGLTESETCLSFQDMQSHPNPFVRRRAPIFRGSANDWLSSKVYEYFFREFMALSLIWMFNPLLWGLTPAAPVLIMDFIRSCQTFGPPEAARLPG